MHLLLVNQFYPPDVAPTGVYLHDVADAMVRRGHAVTVLCSRRGYGGEGPYPSETGPDGVRVVRLPACGFGRGRPAGKLLDYATYCVSLMAGLLLVRPRPDAVLCLTTPPYAGVAVRLAGAFRRWTQLHWVMDVYPDALAAHGFLQPDSCRYRALAGLARFQYAASRRVTTLGADMARRLSVHTPAGCKVTPAPLWVTQAVAPDEADAAAALRRERGWEGRLVCLYSGNVGPGHRILDFLELAVADERTFAGPPPHIVFCGGGRRMQDVRRFRQAHPNARLEVLDYVPAERLAAHLRSADVLLAGLEPAWAGCILPSKVQAAMGAGQPLLYVGPADNDMARWLNASGAGWVVAPGNAAGMKAAVTEAADPRVRARMGRAGREYARLHFAREAGTRRLCEWVEASV